MEGYEIRRDVPLPTRGMSKYPWPEMEAGDCVFIPLEEVTKGKVNNVRTAATSWLARNRPELECTVEMDRDAGGARVWFYTEDS